MNSVPVGTGACTPSNEKRGDVICALKEALSQLNRQSELLHGIEGIVFSRPIDQTTPSDVPPNLLGVLSEIIRKISESNARLGEIQDALNVLFADSDLHLL